MLDSNRENTDQIRQFQIALKYLMSEAKRLGLSAIEKDLAHIAAELEHRFQ